MRQVSVIGGHRCTQEIQALAFEVGCLLAEANVTVVCGGRGGVMAGVCAGAHTANGTTVGILPDADAVHVNPDIDIVIPTGIGLARNQIVALSGRAVIAIDGAAGTLSEICFARQHQIPVIGLHTWNDARLDVIAVTTAEEAVALALRYVNDKTN